MYKRQIRTIIEDYILEREQMTNLFVLIDSRLEPQKIDLEFMEWLGENGIPFSIIFTKADKLKGGRLKMNINAYLRELGKQWEEPVSYTHLDHTDEGTMGLIINKPLPIFVNDIIKEFKYINDIPLYKGGPVATDTLFYLHTLANISGAIPVSKGLYLNGDFDEIKKYILQGNKVDQHIRFFLGYCGWEGEQLNDELKENTWLVSKEDKDYLMNSDTKDMWKEALEKLGSKYEAWSRFPRVPTFN